MGYDGERGRELTDILQENEQLKKKVEKLTEEVEGRYKDDIRLLEKRVNVLERAWWNNIFRKGPAA